MEFRRVLFRSRPKAHSQSAAPSGPSASIGSSSSSSPLLSRERAADAFDLTVLQVVMDVLAHLLHLACADREELLHLVRVERLARQEIGRAWGRERGGMNV